jgi:hypothetical protein
MVVELFVRCSFAKQCMKTIQHLMIFHKLITQKRHAKMQ